MDGPAAEADLPLCVDLDGTLVLSDSLHEALVACLLSRPGLLFRIPGWLAGGKARFKEKVAEAWEFDPSLLPYNAEFLAYLRKERAAGRYIVLCTATHRRIAERIAAELGLFDEIVATEGGSNLRGGAKAEALTRRFGEGGFIYAGNDRSDEPVWEAAAAAIVVNAEPGLEHAADSRFRVLAAFPRRRGAARAALRAMRPYQWVKNLLCLVPLVAAGDFAGTAAWLNAGLLTVSFCLVASSIYIVNDFSDLAADRAHPNKRRRPFAAGELSLLHGAGLAAALMLAGLLAALYCGGLVFVAAYAASSLAYSLRLKSFPLLDVFMLAFLYTIRLLGGGVVSGHFVSQWLLGFSSFLFMSLALIKRVAEATRDGQEGKTIARRGYTPEDWALLQTFGCAATFASSIVLALYVHSDAATHVHGNTDMLWGAVPLLLFWQCRLWLSTARGRMHDDPIVFAARDWVSWLVGGALGLVVLAAELSLGR